MGYDSWLEAPYQDAVQAQEEWEEAEEHYKESGAYDEDIEVWLEENPHRFRGEYEGTEEYRRAVKGCWDTYNNPDDYWD